MEFELGQTYSGYKFLDVVMRSRSAVQYRVENTLAQRVESLRTLTEAAGDDPAAAERFLREVRVRARLSHPHILTFYTAVPIEGRMAMTTEMADWRSLAERLKHGPLDWREALDIAGQLLEALACIHQQSFVHCDITPENILLGPGGFCKLADFSLARPLDAARTSESGAVVGNPRYISPEQVRGERDLDHRSDLYSAGVVLYEMLCGRPPFESRSHFELMMAHVMQSPAPPSGLQPNVPQFLDAVVLKALAKDARDRYPSAAAFAGAIRSAPAAAAAEPAPASSAAIVDVGVPEGVPVIAVAVAEAVAPESAPVLVDAMVVPEPMALESAPVSVPELAESTEPSPVVEEA
jgi:serine/threonine protein kinase